MEKQKFIHSVIIILLVMITPFLMAPARAANPFLPLWEYLPDAEPYIFEDPDNPGQYRIYIYGSHDSMKSDYCGREQVLWSAPVNDLNNWRYDGIIFESKTDANGKVLNPNGLGDVLFASDIAESIGKDGKKTYYFYPNNQSKGRNGMIAKSNRPDGPFVVCNWSPDNPQETVGDLKFDPAVFVDDDGKVYGYWGFQESWGAELDPKTMATVKDGTQPVKDLVSNLHQDGKFRFFEASSMRKIKDKYIFIYSRWTENGEFGLPGSNYTLAYAYSDHPLGPFTYGGTIIDGRGRDTDADGKPIVTASPSGNTHGSILQINGQWYVFYHRQAGTNEYARQAMVAPINVKVTEGAGGKVEISEGEYNSEGFEIKGLDPFKRYSAGIACYYTGPKPAYHSWPNMYHSGSYIKPTYLTQPLCGNPYNLKISSNPVVNNTNGSVVGYKYFNFDHIKTGNNIELAISLIPQGVDGTIDIYINSPWGAKGGIKIGNILISKHAPLTLTEMNAKVSGLNKIKGKHALYFVFKSTTQNKSICELHHFGFIKSRKL